MADAEDIEKVLSSPPDPSSEGNNGSKEGNINGEDSVVSEEGKSQDILSEALSKMNETGQEDAMDFAAAAPEIAESSQANDAEDVSRVLQDKQDAECEQSISDEAQTFAGVEDRILMADSTSGHNALIDETTDSQASLTNSTKIETSDAVTLPLMGASTSAGAPASSNVLSDIAASSLLGSIATMIDSGSECSLTDSAKHKDSLGILESSVTSAPAGTSLCASIPTAVTATPAGLTRSVQNMPMLVNGNSLLSTANNIITSLGTVPSLLSAPLVQAVPQQTVASTLSAPALRVAATTPSPVTITVRTPPGTGALSQALISNIVNTPEVQALLAKNPGQPITIVRVPDAPAPTVVTTQSPAPAAPPPKPSSTPTPTPTLATVSSPAVALTPSQNLTIPVMKSTPQVITKPPPTMKTFPPGTVLSNKLVTSSSPTPKTPSSQSSPLPKPSPTPTSPKSAVILGLKKKVGRGGGKAPKGMAPAVPSSQDLNLLRQKRPANCKTRSGRVSRPPLYRIKEYKTMSNEGLSQKQGSSDGEYSDYDESEGGSSKAGVYDDPKRRFKCQNCEKRYIGKGGLARHYRENPTHGDPESLFEKSEDEEKPDETDDKVEINEDAPASQTPEKSNGEHTEPSPASEIKPAIREILVTDTTRSSSAAGSTPTSMPGATRGGLNKPRGRGRGRPPGRPPSVGRKVVEQSGEVTVPVANSKDAVQTETPASKGEPKFFDPNSPLDDDLVKVALPMLSKLITPWEFLLARTQQTAPKEPLIPTVLLALQELHSEIKKMASSCLDRHPEELPATLPRAKAKSPRPSPKVTGQQLVIKDEALARVLGLDTGRYCIKDLPEDSLPKAFRLMKKQLAPSGAGDASQEDSQIVKKAAHVLQRKRKVGGSEEEPAIKKISLLSSAKSAQSKRSTSPSAATKTVPSIGNIASIAADVPVTRTAVKNSVKRPIPPLGPISSSAKGFGGAGNKVNVSTLPPLKPIKTKPPESSQPAALSDELASSSVVPAAITVGTGGVGEEKEKGDAAKTTSPEDGASGSGIALVTSQDQVGDAEKDQTVAAPASEPGGVMVDGGDGEPSLVGGGEELTEQTTILPEGTTIMQLEDGTFLLQKPDGTAMQIQTPEGMSIETVQALLSMEGGAVEEQPPQYVLDDGSCLQLPAGMSLDTAVEMGLINQPTNDAK